MAGNQRSRNTGIPRVYDKSSGEYRPVFGHQGNAPNRRSGKYATPQRRAEARRRRKRRALIAFYLFVFVTVIACAAALSLTVLFKIDTVSVEGKSSYPADQIISLSGIKKGQNLFLTNTDAAEKRILQNLPYIGAVNVKRRLPARILISVSEEPVCGVISYNKKFVVLGASGKVLEIVDQVPTNQTLIQGVTLTDASVGKAAVYKDSTQKTMFEDLIAAIEAAKLDKVTKIDLSKTYQITVVYDNRINMNLGPASDLEKKLRFGKNILESGKIKNTERGALDLSTSAEDEHAYFDPNYSVSSGKTS